LNLYFLTPQAQGEALVGISDELRGRHAHVRTLAAAGSTKMWRKHPIRQTMSVPHSWRQTAVPGAWRCPRLGRHLRRSERKLSARPIFKRARGKDSTLPSRARTSVVGAIGPKLEQAEIERTKHKPTESLDAYDYFLRGMAEVHQSTGCRADTLAVVRMKTGCSERLCSLDFRNHCEELHT
jgi:hypothetical protein